MKLPTVLLPKKPVTESGNQMVEFAISLVFLSIVTLLVLTQTNMGPTVISWFQQSVQGNPTASGTIQVQPLGTPIP